MPYNWQFSDDSTSQFMPYKLLFVCLGNICRSPAAENIMNYLIEQEGLSAKILCDSAGTAGYHIGSPPDSRMNTAAKKRGIPLPNRRVTSYLCWPRQLGSISLTPCEWKISLLIL